MAIFVPNRTEIPMKTDACPYDPACFGKQELLTPKEAVAYLRVSKSHLDKLRVYGGGPKFLRPGKRKILYRRSHLDLYAAERTFTSTSEYREPAIDQSECTSNNRKSRHKRYLRKYSD